MSSHDLQVVNAIWLSLLGIISGISYSWYFLIHRGKGGGTKMEKSKRVFLAVILVVTSIGCAFIVTTGGYIVYKMLGY